MYTMSPLTHKPYCTVIPSLLYAFYIGLTSTIIMALAVPINQAAMTALVAPDPLIVAPLTIIQRYDNHQAFLCLLNNIGVDTKERYRLGADGFMTLRNLVDHFRDDVDVFHKYLQTSNKTWINNTQVMMRAYFTPVIINRLVGLLYYYKVCVRMLHTVPDTNIILANQATEFGTQYYNSTRATGGDDDDNSSDIKIPDLKGADNWVSFRDNFLLKMSMITGSRGISIDYVVDSTPRGATRANNLLIQVPSIDLTQEDLLRTKTVHFGDAFKIDNTTVWNMLSSLLTDKPAFTHINSFKATKDGRRAWLALQSFHEGQDFKERLRESALNKLQSTFYNGEKARFNMEKYITVHLEAHKKLQDAGYNGGLGIDEETKIHYFRSGIREEAKLEYAISLARNNPAYNTFEAYTAHMNAEVELKNRRKSELKANTQNSRQVSGVQSNNRGNKGGKGTQKGRDTNKKLLSAFIDGKKVEGRSYDNKEWKAMTANQRKKVIQLQKESRQSKANTSSVSTRQDIQQDLITLGEAIVAGVARASNESTDQSSGGHDAGEDNTSTVSGLTKRTAGESGSIGNIFRRQRRRNNNDNNNNTA